MKRLKASEQWLIIDLCVFHKQPSYTLESVPGCHTYILKFASHCYCYEQQQKGQTEKFLNWKFIVNSLDDMYYVLIPVIV